MRLRALLLPLGALILAGCVLPTPDEFQEEQARFNREFAKNLRASRTALRGPPPRPIEEMRADAMTQLNALARLRDQVLGRLDELERNPNAGPDQRRYATTTASRIDLEWHSFGFAERARRQIASDDWTLIQHTANELNNRKPTLEQRLAETNHRLRRLGGNAATSLGPVPPAEQRLSDAIEGARAKASAAMNEVETLHDELIRLLEARISALGDDAAKKRVADAITLARLAKRQDMDLLRGDVAADAQWRIEGALSKAAIIRDQLQAQIADLKE